MKTIAILIATIFIVVFGYGNTIKAKQIKQSNANVLQQKRQYQENEKIELNQGKKWKVDKNMLVYIRHMEQNVVASTAAGQSNYRELSDKLKADINLLTSNCTMKGKAHDELHKWLLPYISLVNQLSKVKNETEAAGYISEIQSSFKTFNQYFQ